MSIYATGDCHGTFRRFGRKYFPEPVSYKHLEKHLGPLCSCRNMAAGNNRGYRNVPPVFFCPVPGGPAWAGRLI